MCAAPRVQLFVGARAMDGRGIIGLCQSVATSNIVKALLVTSLTRTSSTIASSRPLA